MKSESGHMKVLGNFGKLVESVSADANYNPSNQKITKAALPTQDTAATAAVEDVANKNAPYKTAIQERAEAFEVLPARARQVRNVAKASGASEAALANLETPLRKLAGVRASAKPKPDPNAGPDAPVDPQHSASQMSFDNRLGSFRSFVALVKELPSYNPNEADLKVTALEAYADDLDAKNNVVITTGVALTQARTLRDQLLYTNADSVVNNALLVKAYVKGAFGASSPLYKQIKGLEFGRKN
ncbi:MAG: hypothetical protein H7Z16_19610 [Pyrinomonadaceae bacterium]|nr:hypothetical protein [Pyrinomonadaceae bacterium]